MKRALKYGLLVLLQCVIVAISYFAGATMFGSHLTKEHLRMDILLGLRAYNAVQERRNDRAMDVLGITLIGKRDTLQALEQHSLNIHLIKYETRFKEGMDPYFEQIAEIEEFLDGENRLIKRPTE